MLSQLPKSLPEALSLMEKASELEPENKAVLLNLGTVYTQLGRLEDAEKALGKLNELDPDYPDLHFNRAHVYMRQGRNREAFLEAQTEIRRDPDNVHAKQLIEGLRSVVEQTEQERGSDN
jgi:tetratricopeptide (TPR) repeat protein